MLNYSYPLFRPPAEANNLILQVTLGCSYNSCSFCSMYKSKKYKIRELSDIYDDIDRLAFNYPNAIKIFLADGDALSLKTSYVHLNDTEILHEQKDLLRQLNPKNKVIFRSNHASNALYLSGTLPKDKKKLKSI